MYFFHEEINLKVAASKHETSKNLERWWLGICRSLHLTLHVHLWLYNRVDHYDWCDSDDDHSNSILIMMMIMIIAIIIEKTLKFNCNWIESLISTPSSMNLLESEISVSALCQLPSSSRRRRKAEKLITIEKNVQITSNLIDFSQ